MDIKYSKDAAKYISRLDRSTKQRLRQSIEKLPGGHVKPMEGSKNPKYRLRVGDYRVLFSINEIIIEEDGKETTAKIILIEEIGPRGDVYK